jgi:excisionase family DNA binding protein
MKENKKYLTIKEAAAYLGVTPLTMRNWDKSGKFLAGRHPISNYRIYKPEHLEILLKEIEAGDTSHLKIIKKEKPKFKKLRVRLEED